MSQPAPELKFAPEPAPLTPLSLEQPRPEELPSAPVSLSLEELPASPAEHAAPVPQPAPPAPEPARNQDRPADAELDLEALFGGAGVTAVAPSAEEPFAIEPEPAPEQPLEAVAGPSRDLGSELLQDLGGPRPADQARPMPEPEALSTEPEPARNQEPEQSLSDFLDLDAIIQAAGREHPPEPPPAEVVAPEPARLEAEERRERSIEVNRLALDDRLEINLEFDRPDPGDGRRLLTVDQALDALGKKTVRCPVCGTMNFAIRWYCENCEATLTSL